MTTKDLLLLTLTVTLILGLAAGYQVTGSTVTVVADGTPTELHTHSTTVAGALAEAGFATEAADNITPAVSATVTDDLVIELQRSRHVSIRADGITLSFDTYASEPRDILAQSGITLHPHDVVYVNGKSLSLPTSASSGDSQYAAFSGPLSSTAAPAPALSAGASPTARPAALDFVIRRAVSLTVTNDNMSTPIVTTSSTVGEALFNQGIYVFAADRVTPALDAPVAAGLNVSIVRAKPVSVTADEETVGVRTQVNTVAQLIQELRIPTSPKDYTTPPLQSSIVPGLAVQLIRVNEDFVTVSEEIPYETVMLADANLELDQRATAVVGMPGVFKRTTRIVYENGREVSRNLDREWVDEKPVNQVIAYGTKIVLREMQTPDGPVQYWREARFWVTYYTPLHAGTPMDVPWFGITATGLRAQRGIIAVDPRVVPMHTRIYVPGYGIGVAEDTGGLINGKILDLCYDDGDPTAYQRGWWLVYFLTPVPADVPYLLPSYPSWGDIAPGG